MNNWNISIIEWLGLWFGLTILLIFIEQIINKLFKGNSHIEISEKQKVSEN